MPNLSRLRRSVRLAARLRDCEGGLAFVEFAMALPILITFAFCGIETANYAMAHLRVSNISMMVSDNASRIRDSIDEANIVEIMTGAKMAGDGIGFRQNGRIILSSVERNAAPASATNSLYIRWQRCDGQRNAVSHYGAEGYGTGTNLLPEVGPTGNRIKPLAGTAVMVVEVSYRYQPLISEAIIGQRTITYETAFIVRQRTNQALTNTSSLSSAQRRTCNHFQS